MNRRYFSGNTIEQAVLAAASHYGIEPERLAYRHIEKRHGFVKTRRRVVIQVDPDAPVAEERPAPSPRREGRDERPRGEHREQPRDERREQPRGEDREQPRDERREQPRGEDRERPRDERREQPRDERRERPRSERRERPRDEGRKQTATPPGERRQPWWAQKPDESGPDLHDDPAPAAEPRPDEGRVEEPAAAAAPTARAVAFEDRDDAERSPRPMITAAAQAVEKVVQLAGLDLRARIRLSGDRIEVDLVGTDVPRVVAEDGEVLEAIEYLLPRVLRGLAGESRPFKVDSGGFRAQREEKLRQLALDTADRVAESERTETLEPMNPAERRIVHLALADHPEVVTESRGEGLYKRVAVQPA